MKILRAILLGILIGSVTTAIILIGVWIGLLIFW